MKKLFRKLAHTYNNFHIQKKLTISHLIIVTIPIIVIITFFYFTLYDMIMSDTIRSEQAQTGICAAAIEDKIGEITAAYERLHSDSFFKDLTHARRRELSLMPAFASNGEHVETLCRDLMKDGFITDIQFYLDLPEPELLIAQAAAPERVLSIDRARGTYWYGIFRGDPKLGQLFCPSFYLNTYELEHRGDMAYITRFYLNKGGEYVPCYLAVYFSQQTIEDALNDSLTSSGNVAYLINTRNNIVAASNVAMAGVYHLNYDEVEKYFMSSNNFISKNVSGQDVYAGFYSIGQTDWFMVVAMPSQPMIEKSNYIVGLFMLVFILCILFAFWIANLLSKSLTSRLSAVAGQMAKAKTGLPAPMENPGIKDEIGDVIDTYNYMSRMIRRMTQEQTKAAEDLRIAEFNSLQAQINPHFLYNTMDMINWLANQGKSHQVTLAVQKLSRFYKLTLSQKDTLTTIASELEHAAIYVELQNMRFHHQIEFVVDVPDELLDKKIPKLTFQPVVENAIMHGILEKESKTGTIVLTGWFEGEDAVILISDDGVGMNPQQLASILLGQGSAGKTNGSNIAVFNTHQRIQIIFGRQYGLSYSSTPGKGTDVEIRIPN